MPMINERTPDVSRSRRSNAFHLAYGTLQVTTRADDHAPDRAISPNPYMRHLLLELGEVTSV